jgi:hypothetical protein
VHAVILGQPSLPELLEKSGPMPVLKMLVHRASRAELSGQCFAIECRCAKRKR